MQNVYDAHRQLYHYTNLAGLWGILESQTLWGTHYKGLNDFSEVEHMRAFLEASVYPIVNRIMRERVRQSLRFRRHVERHGGLHVCSQQEARTTVSILYGVTFEGRKGGKIGAFSEPYVVSFCAHTDHDEYVKANGLLSMWRAYGNEGGFALVFDTKRLWKCLESEYQTYGYTGFYLADVVYDDEEKKFEKEFGELTQTIEQFVRDRLVDTAEPGNMFQPFFNAVTRFKHRGFKEEREVRLVAAPVSEALAKAVRESASEDEAASDQRIKPILSREKGGHGIPYIVLNDVPKKQPLPIVRIIVGPQHNLPERVNKVRELVGDHIEVVPSATPYIPI